MPAAAGGELTMTSPALNTYGKNQVPYEKIRFLTKKIKINKKKIHTQLYLPLLQHTDGQTVLLKG